MRSERILGGLDMSFSEWREVALKDVIEFNPKESIKKGTITKKIGMDKLAPFQRKIDGFELEAFKGGSKFRNGDTLLARITPCLENGKTAQVTILDDDDEVAFGSTEYIVLRHKIGITDNNYIFYLALSQYVRDTAIKSMTGTSGRQRAQTDVIENTKIMLPPLEEQKAIAHILSTLDDKIEVNNQINKTLENMAQAIFKQWFVDFEFPNEDGEPYKSSGGEMIESELGMIPKGWEVVKLNSVVDICYGKNLPTKNLLSDGYPVFGGNGQIGFYSEYLYEKSQVLIACRGAASGKVIISLPYSFVTNNSLVLEQNGTSVTHEYLKQFCLENEFYNYATGSAQPQITIANLANANILIPQRDLMNMFSLIRNSIDHEVLSLFNENNKLVAIRDALLPKLMSGEIRVSLDAEDDAS